MESVNYGDFVVENSFIKKYKGNDQVVRIPEGIISIGTRAFEKKQNLRKVILSKSLRSIGVKAFFECSALEDINLIEWAAESGKSKEGGYYHGSVAKDSFWGCDLLGDKDGFIIRDGILFGYTRKDMKNVKVPKGVEQILNGVFAYSDHDTVTLPDGLKRIRVHAFNGSHIKSIEIPDSVTDIEEGAFESCKLLERVKLPKNLKKISEKAFRRNFSLRSIEIPEGVKALEDECFFECPNMKKVVLPSTLKEIGSYAFACCRALTSIDVPAGVKVIGRGAFWPCDILQCVTIGGDNVRVGEGIINPEVTRIVCSRELKSKLPKELKRVCTVVDNKETDRRNYYRVIDRLDVDRMITDAAPKYKWEKPVYPKDAVFEVDAGGFKAEMKIKLASSLRKTSSQALYGFKYDMYEAAEHLLSAEEVRDIIFEIDPGAHTDAFMYAQPEISDDAEKLSFEAEQKRLIFITYIAHKLADESVMAKIAAAMPKKKNGTFMRSRVFRIATACIATNDPPQLLELVAKPDSDNSATVMAMMRNLDEEEVELFEDDFVISHPEIFHIGDYLNVGSKKAAGFTDEYIESAEDASPEEEPDPLEEIISDPVTKESRQNEEQWLADYGEYVTKDFDIDFDGAIFAFTGINDEPGDPLVEAIKKRGGFVRTRVTGKVQYLIASPKAAGNSKPCAVLDYNEDGKDIKIILAKDFIKKYFM